MLLAGVPVSAQTTNPSGRELPSQAEVEFNQPMLVKDVVNLANKHKIKISQLQSSYVIGPTEIQDGYVNPEAGTATQLEADYAKERLDYFADVIASESEMPNQERIELLPRLNAMKAALQKQNSGPVSVSKATFYGEILNLQGLAKSGIPAKVNVIDKELMQKLIQNKIQREILPRNFGPENNPNQANQLLNVQRLSAALHPNSLFKGISKNTTLLAQTS